MLFSTNRLLLNASMARFCTLMFVSSPPDSVFIEFHPALLGGCSSSNQIYSSISGLQDRQTNTSVVFSSYTYKYKSLLLHCRSFRSYLLNTTLLSYIFVGLIKMRGAFLCLSLLASLASFALGDASTSGNTVTFPIKLTWEKGSPDGFERDMILVNGQFPGPTLNLNEGDNVEFTVDNQLPWGTTIHFHGIE